MCKDREGCSRANSLDCFLSFCLKLKFCLNDLNEKGAHCGCVFVISKYSVEQIPS